MIRSRFASIVAIACMAASAIASAAWDTGHAIVSAVCSGWNYLFGPVSVAPADPKSEASARPRVALMKARAFFARQIKRERPTVTPYWRMCPSI